MNPRGVRLMAAAVAGAVCLAGACAVRPQGVYRGVRVDPAALINPFAPVEMQIHPLTRIDRDASGRLWIICHIELRDVWGDPSKGVGAMQIQLYRPIGARPLGQGIQELKWDVDLSDMERNARLYDPATRTYRLALKDQPEWLAEAPEAGASRAVLRAVFTTAGPLGEPLVLQHELLLQ